MQPSLLQIDIRLCQPKFHLMLHIQSRWIDQKSDMQKALLIFHNQCISALRKVYDYMAIYHLEAKIISRVTGRSVVAAAYMSCSKLYNDYDGIEHDYTRKHGLVHQEIMLPTNAPPEWADREKLWNAVEEAEKTKDSRLAREFVAALPIEMSKDDWIDLLRQYIGENFVSEGMCADFAIHDTDGHNPPCTYYFNSASSGRKREMAAQDRERIPMCP